nr:MAG TPA: hypothetical protein [Caudoviricetes sp.]
MAVIFYVNGYSEFPKKIVILTILPPSLKFKIPFESRKANRFRSSS